MSRPRVSVSHTVNLNVWVINYSQTHRKAVSRDCLNTHLSNFVLTVLLKTAATDGSWLCINFCYFLEGKSVVYTSFRKLLVGFNLKAEVFVSIILNANFV